MDADEEGTDLPWDGEHVGELMLRGPWVASSYFDDPERSAVDRNGREFHVDLLVTRDAGQFTGRMRELRSPAPVSAELYLAAKAYERRERIEVARMTTLIESPSKCPGNFGNDGSQ